MRADDVERQNIIERGVPEEEPLPVTETGAEEPIPATAPSVEETPPPPDESVAAESDVERPLEEEVGEESAGEPPL